MPVARYSFQASGQEQVIAAFRSISQSAAMAESSVEKAFAGVPQAAKRAGDRTVSADRQTAAKRNAALERAEQQRRAKLQRAQEAEIRELERKLAKEIKAEEKASREKVKLAEREARKLAALSEKETRLHAKEAEKRTRKAAREAAKAWKNVRSELGSIQSVDRQSRFRGAIAALGTAAIGGIATAGLAGGAVAGQLTRESIALDDRARRLAIQGGGDPSQIRRSFERAAVAVPGAKAGDLIGGAESFVGKTGNAEAAQRFAKTIARTSVATGASATDLGAVSADLFEKFDIQTDAQMRRALATLAVQGKRGSFELKDAASQYSRLTAAASGLGIGKGVDAIATLGGLTQIARSATGSPEQAATALEATFRQLTANSGKLERSGVKVFNDDGSARNVVDVLTEAVSKVGGGDIQAKKVGLQKIFGEEGIRALRPLISKFSEVAAEGGNTKEALADAEKALRDYINGKIDATGAEEELQRDLATAQGGTSTKLTAAWEAMRASIGERVTPAVQKLAAKLTELSKSSAFGALETTIVAVIEAFELMVDGLVDMGLIQRKQKTASDKLAEVNEELATVEADRKTIADKARRGEELSQEDINTLATLWNKEADLAGQRNLLQDELFKPIDEASPLIGKDEFVERYLGAAPDHAKIMEMAQQGFPEQLDQRRSAAEELFNDIVKDPTARAGLDYFANDEEKSALQDLRTTVTTAQTSTGPAGEQAKAALEGAGALMRFNKAIAAAESALQRLGTQQGSTAFVD